MDRYFAITPYATAPRVTPLGHHASRAQWTAAEPHALRIRHGVDDESGLPDRAAADHRMAVTPWRAYRPVMGDGIPITCGWCGIRLPSDRAGVRRYCRPAHRQAAYRARQREARLVRSAINPQVAVVFIAEDMTVLVEALKELVSDLAAHHRLGVGGLHSTAVARFPGLVEDLITCAVIADRRSGATWAEIGTALDLTAETARARYGHRRLNVEWPIPAAPR